MAVKITVKKEKTEKTRINFNGVTHFYECLLPTSLCNLSCEYCYLIQENKRSMESISFDYSINQMLYALRSERVAPNGGLAFFSLCGKGETLLQQGCIELVAGLLKEGHLVNVTTNGTISRAFDELTKLETASLSRLQIAFSFHYLELKKRNLIEVFFENVKKMKKAGCSIVVQMNLYDGYIPYLDEIKQLCQKQIGAPPQLAATRLEPKGTDLEEVSLHTDLPIKEYIRLGKTYDSPLFDFTIQNFGVKRREFCYAGDWTHSLHLQDGRLSPCYQSYKCQYIFRNADKPIDFSAIGHSCKSLYCINSSHFLALGVAPEIECPSYSMLRDRKEARWYNESMKLYLGQKLYDNNPKYSFWKKRRAECRYWSGKIICDGKRFARWFKGKIVRWKKKS